jgi:hydroxypyruvate reductase
MPSACFARHRVAGQEGIHALAGDTDGVDGARRVRAPTSVLIRWPVRGQRPEAEGHLADNDGHGFFQKLGQSVITGPTMTNVNDFRAVLITDANTRRG